jgi:hypothetical protein
LNPKKFLNNHQVLAIGYRLHKPSPSDKPSHWDVLIYDPNFPAEIHALHYHEDFRVQTLFASDLAHPVSPTHRLNDNDFISGSFRAFFYTGYTGKTPPWISTAKKPKLFTNTQNQTSTTITSEPKIFPKT